MLPLTTSVILYMCCHLPFFAIIGFCDIADVVAMTILCDTDHCGCYVILIIVVAMTILCDIDHCGCHDNFM